MASTTERSVDWGSSGRVDWYTARTVDPFTLTEIDEIYLKEGSSSVTYSYGSENHMQATIQVALRLYQQHKAAQLSGLAYRTAFAIKLRP